MNTKEYKVGGKNYKLPAVYNTNNGYVSVTKVNGNNIRVYIPTEETTKIVGIEAIDKANIISTEQPLDLKNGDVYTITSPQKNGKLQFTVVSVNENDLQLKILKGGKTYVSGEFSVVDFSALIKTLEQTDGFNVVSERKSNTTSGNIKKWIIGGIVLLAVGGIYLGLRKK